MNTKLAMETYDPGHSQMTSQISIDSTRWLLLFRLEPLLKSMLTLIIWYMLTELGLDG
jgi:hypothetical protein